MKTQITFLFLICTFLFFTSSTFGQGIVEITGQVKITGGTPGANKVLTSNAVGLATWQSDPQSDFAYIYNLSFQFVPPEVPVLFDSNGSITAGFTHVPGSSDISIINAGIYKVSYSVSAVESNQFAVFLSGVLVPGSIYGSGDGTQQNNGQVIFSAVPGNVLSLRNHTSVAPVTLQNIVGGTQLSVNASVLIQRLQ